MDNRKIISALAIVTLLMLVATTAGCTTTTPSPTPTAVPETMTTVGNNTTFSSATGFNITFPSALKNDTTTNASLPVRIYIYLTNNTAEGINVGVQQLKNGSTLGQFTYDQLSEIRRASETGLYKNATTPIVNNNTTISGKPATQAVYQATVPAQLSQTAVQNVTLKVSNIFVINNDRGYTITYKATPANYDKYQQQATRIISTFKLI